METKYRVLFIVNPISGGIDKTDIVDHVKERVKKQHAELHIYYTSGENDKEEVTQLVQNFQPDRILIAGGDGSIKLVAEVLDKKQIPIGLFPAGSANGLAENLELPSALEKIADIAFGDNFVNVDCIVVNDELCLHISDVGLNAALIKNYEEGNIRGKLGYLIQSIPTLIKSDFPFQFKIKVNGETHHHQAVLLAIANAKKYGTGAKINPKGKFNDGKFEILIFKRFDVPQILRTFQEDFTAENDFLEILPASEATIECEQKVPFQIDGEYRGEVKQVSAKISSVQLTMAAPPLIQ
ncbi:diacylglycerol/lipid kinase family protein [Salinimicrobium sp. GXAS 041]|uniref:diacylglycerol/lipid kinase family protein n=1 Tax=Salinimicrobium sp. GXAS 041 TaxID=3400806 RepID=UPI003C72C52F